MSLDPSNKGEEQGQHTQACEEEIQQRTESDETKDNVGCVTTRIATMSYEMDGAGGH